MVVAGRPWDWFDGAHGGASLTSAAGATSAQPGLQPLPEGAEPRVLTFLLLPCRPAPLSHHGPGRWGRSPLPSGQSRSFLKSQSVFSFFKKWRSGAGGDLCLLLVFSLSMYKLCFDKNATEIDNYLFTLSVLQTPFHATDTTSSSPGCGGRVTPSAPCAVTDPTIPSCTIST